MTTPTPETDAAENKNRSHTMGNNDYDLLLNLARKLERERDAHLFTIDKAREEWEKDQSELTQLRKDNETFRNAQKSCADCDAPTFEEVKQLRKVCDELAQFGEGLNDSLDDYLHLLAGHDRTCDCDRCETWRAYIKALTNYSTLPHVIKAKENKQ